MVDLNNKISIFVDKELKTLGDKEFAKSRNRLISDKVISYGVETQEIRKVARKYFNQFRERKRKRVCLEAVKELMSIRVFEDQMVGIFFLELFLKTGGKISISEIKKLITEYIDNWATCDTISSEVVAKILKRSPEKIEVLYTWVKSRNIWLKRVALVTTVKLKNKIENWQEVASQILSFSEKEKEPIIKKAVHWLEKELF